jgi:hypothetical protein
MIYSRFQFTYYTFDFHFFYNALLYFQTIDNFLLIPLCTEIIYMKSTNKIIFLLDYLILCLLFKYYRSRYSPKWQDCVKEIRSITPNQSLSHLQNDEKLEAQSTQQNDRPRRWNKTFISLSYERHNVCSPSGSPVSFE